MPTLVAMCGYGGRRHGSGPRLVNPGGAFSTRGNEGEINPVPSTKVTQLYHYIGDPAKATNLNADAGPYTLALKQLHLLPEHNRRIRSQYFKRREQDKANENAPLSMHGIGLLNPVFRCPKYIEQ
ncbi:hypothetical protein E4U53_008032 [Claviceps sorghi]|nr:hypothetical protein E4U53_008032 [Claviceps sorghi]